PEAELLDAPIDVGEDLGLFGEAPGPVGLRGEREGIEASWDVAPAPRIDVVPPGAADAVRLLEDGEVGKATTDELHAHGQARHATPDDEDARDRPPGCPGR